MHSYAELRPLSFGYVVELSDQEELDALQGKISSDFERLTNFSLEIITVQVPPKEGSTDNTPEEFSFLKFEVPQSGLRHLRENMGVFIRSIDYHVGRDRYNIITSHSRS